MRRFSLQHWQQRFNHALPNPLLSVSWVDLNLVYENVLQVREPSRQTVLS